MYTENAASQGEWTYTFRNVTIDAFGEQQAEIRIELIVTDGTEEDVAEVPLLLRRGSRRFR